jgi:hypothetical protein
MEQPSDALDHSQTVDITTTAPVGRARRIEIALHNIRGRLVISGRASRTRAWIYNLEADPK